MNFLANPPVTLHTCLQHFRSGRRKFWEERQLKLVFNGRSESAQAAAEKHMFEPKPKIWLP